MRPTTTASLVIGQRLKYKDYNFFATVLAVYFQCGEWRFDAEYADGSVNIGERAESGYEPA